MTADDRRLDVDDAAMWSQARRPPLSTEAVHRIAARLTEEQGARSGAPPRLRVWAAASVLVLIGGAAGATVTAFVIKRPGREAVMPTVKPAVTSPLSRRSRAEAPPVEAPEVSQQQQQQQQQQQPEAAPVVTPRPTSPLRSLAARGPSAPVAVAMQAPIPRVVSPAAAPPAPPPAPSVSPAASENPPPPNGAAAEAGLLRAVMAALPRDPAGALTLLDRYDAQFPNGTLHGEAKLARARSLRDLGRDDELLRLLDGTSFDGLPRAAELRVLRGELRSKRGRLHEALDDFQATLAAGGPDAVLERALFGRASCRTRMGDSTGARADLRRFLERYPASPRGAEVRAALAR